MKFLIEADISELDEDDLEDMGDRIEDELHDLGDIEGIVENTSCDNAKTDGKFELTIIFSAQPNISNPDWETVETGLSQEHRRVVEEFFDEWFGPDGWKIISDVAGANDRCTWPIGD